MKFRTNTGSQPNASGLAQIAPGSRSIPQSFLNGIGRVVDKATVRVGGASVPFMQTAGGFTLEIPDAAAAKNTPQTYLHPFRVIYVGQSNGGFLCNIMEGRITGRADFAYADWQGTVQGEPVSVPSIGTPGLNPDFGGVWPDNTPAPDPGKTDTNATSSGSQTVTGDSESGSTNHTVSNVGKPYVFNNSYGLSGPFKSGNAGSITRPDNSSGIYHTPWTATGNNGYISGNAGSFTRGLGNSSGTYHSPLPINGNQTFIGSNQTQTVTLTPNQANTTIMTDKPFTINL